MNNEWYFLGALATSFAITFLAIPSIIRVSELKKLFDEPHNRKSHSKSVPTLGGLGIFAGLIFSISFWTIAEDFYYIKYILSAVIIIFFMGLKDDMVEVAAIKKLFGQLIAATILCHNGDIRVSSFYGLFSIYDIPYNISLPFSVLTVTLITNSFNLIDGINLLAGSIGSLCAVTFGAWYVLNGHNALAVLSFSLLGSLLAFLWFNKTPAKIFMGDTGSLLLGTIIAVLSIKFIEINKVYSGFYHINSVPAVTLGILIVPIFDTLRVFLLRILKGKSPLAADNNHLHHQLLKLGLNHHKACATLILINLFFITFSFLLQSIDGEVLLTLIIIICLSLNWFLAYKIRTKNKRARLTFKKGIY